MLATIIEPRLKYDGLRYKFRYLILIAVLCAIGLSAYIPSIVHAAPPNQERITLNNGTASYTGFVTGNGMSKSYVLRAQVGQQMKIVLTGQEHVWFYVQTPNTYPLNRYGGVREWSGTLPETGDYSIVVYADGGVVNAWYQLDFNVETVPHPTDSNSEFAQFPFTTQFHGVSLNGQSEQLAVEPGTRINGTLWYQIWNQRNCPGCPYQLVVGIGQDAQDCAYGGVPAPYPGTFNTGTFNLIAPANPGAYAIRYQSIQQSTCAQAQAVFENEAPQKTVIIGILVVKPPPPQTVTPDLSTPTGVCYSHNDPYRRQWKVGETTPYQGWTCLPGNIWKRGGELRPGAE